MKHLTALYNKKEYRSSIVFIFLLMMFCFFSTHALAGDKKVVVFIMDRINYLDLEKGNYPAISLIRNRGAEGLINVRSKGMFISKNSESSYLTIGSGFRVDSPDINKVSLAGETLHIDILDGLVKAENNNTVGLLGQTARKNGLQVGLISSSGGAKPFYGSVLMVMDEKGIVPYGNISEKLITKDDSFIGGWKTNNTYMLKGFRDMYKKADIIFVDYSDTNRVYQNKGNQGDVSRAISRGDQLLGSLLKIINNNTEVLFITPNPSTEAIKSFNYSLTPFIIFKPDDSNGQSISSNNTRRPGLALNLDVIPTIYNYFGIKVDQDIVGETINPIHKTPKLKGFYRETYLTNLSIARIIVHVVFFILLLYALVYFKQKKDLVIKEVLCYTIVSYPLSALIVGSMVNYNWYAFDGISVLILAAILGKLSSNLASKHGHVLSLCIISALTSLIIVIETFFFPETVMGTPFGFNDVFIGGRFYGLNNDIMGIMLGSSTLALFTFLHKYKSSAFISTFLSLAYYLILTIVLSPFFGVNVGGSITAMVMLFVSMAVLFEIDLDWKKGIFLVIFVMILQVGISALDNMFNNEVTHAGKAVHSIANQGFSKVLQIITSKLSQVALMAVVPPWNLVLIIQCFILYKYKSTFRQKLEKIKEKCPVLLKGSKVLIWGVVVGFLFNDTGIVASSLMLIYLTVTVTLLLKEGNFKYEADKI